MSKVLFAILTCNRFHYLKNCVDSLFEFVDLTDCEVMILDTRTVEDGVDEYYKSISGKAKIKKFGDMVPNELYRAMNYAIKYCRKNKIPIVNFIQDDYQYIYHWSAMVDNVMKLFSSKKDVGQIQTNMIWHRKKPGKFKKVNIEGINYAILQERMLVDTGFTRVKLYKKIGLYPEGVISYDQKSHKTHGFGKNRYKKTPNGELWFGKKCKKLGYVRAISLHPNMAMMFDCAYVRKWQRFGRYFPPPNNYYLKPFDKYKIKIVNKCNLKKKFMFIEKIIEPDGWNPTTYDKHNREGIIKEIEH